MPPLTIARPLPCRIAGTGAAFPALPDGPAELENADVVSRLAPRGPRGERTPEEIAAVAAGLGETLGVRRRSWAHAVGEPFAADEETTVGLQARAVAAALDDAALSAAELHGIVAATSTPDRVTGANAPQIAARLGARCAATDLRAGCAGGLLALVQACTLAHLGQQPVVAVGGDTFSKLAPPDEPLAGLALGDGAGAAVVLPAGDSAAASGPALLAAAWSADGALGHLAAAPAPFPVTHTAIDDGAYFLGGDPAELARTAPALYGDVIGRVLAAAGVAASDVALLIPHQASRQTIEEVARRCDFDEDRVVQQLDRHANTGTAAVLIALHEARAARRFGDGDLLLLAALGGGLCWAAALLRAG